MTKKKEEAITTAVQEPVKPDEQEEMFPVSEIIPASKKLFGWQPECTAAALKPVKKEQMTLSEVKSIVNEFLGKEIK
jgi:hypothetical protein